MGPASRGRVVLQGSAATALKGLMAVLCRKSMGVFS